MKISTFETITQTYDDGRITRLYDVMNDVMEEDDSDGWSDLTPEQQKKRKLSQQFFLDFQNVTNHENVFTYRFNREKGEVQQVNQIGFFPDVLWRVQF